MNIYMNIFSDNDTDDFDNKDELKNITIRKKIYQTYDITYDIINTIKLDLY